MTNYVHDEKYDELPEVIRRIYTPKEFAWLSDQEKASIEFDNTMPELEED